VIDYSESVRFDTATNSTGGIAAGSAGDEKNEEETEEEITVWCGGPYRG
jgi:hypothetical protein